MYSTLPLPPTLPFTFTTLREMPGRADYEHLLAKYTIASLNALSGGDVAGLFDFLQEKYSKKLPIPKAAAVSNAAHVVSALSSVQKHFCDFLDAQRFLDIQPDENRFIFAEKEKDRKANLGNVKYALRVVNCVFVRSDLSYLACKELGSIQPRSSFMALKKQLSTESLSLSLVLLRKPADCL